MRICRIFRHDKAGLSQPYNINEVTSRVKVGPHKRLQYRKMLFYRAETLPFRLEKSSHLRNIYSLADRGILVRTACATLSLLLFARHSKPLATILVAQRYRHAIDLRDKVYTFLGLFNPLIEVHDGKSVREVGATARLTRRLAG